MEKSSQPLRILVVVNLPWDSRLGASRVWMELAEQWRAMGHTVEKFSLSDAFPGARATRVTFALKQIIFARKAAAFVRKNGSRFDIIDALVGTLPYSKEQLRFGGLIVARSVGLYLLYDRFEQTLEQRWPRPARGKFAGRLLYRFTRRRLQRASAASIRHADLLNVPNEEEAVCLRKEFGADRRILVQPYGLTEERRDALGKVAHEPEDRLRCPRVSFIGMWGARKGAHDWSGIIQLVRAELPQTQFRFLGTMVSAEVIRTDLGDTSMDGIECISDYQPDELPSLLADCTIGAFPSYVEGFGLAVIEQLAAGLPTIAYNVAGPRDILAPRFPELLVPSGDTEKFAAEVCRVLRLNPAAYCTLVRLSLETAAGFSWPDVARETIDAYRRLLREKQQPVLFVQPFSIGSAGGGARILRALLSEPSVASRSVCSSPVKPKAWRDELHVRSRPSWGRLEHSRLAALPNASRNLFTRNFRKRLKRVCVELGARAIHIVPHAGLDFAEVQTVARELALPFFISLHDDLAYTSAGAVRSQKREAAIAFAWQEASARFLISEALGREYCRRYGERDFAVVTDGLTSLTPARLERDPAVLRIYFMGLFHMSYERNLRALLDGIALFEKGHPEVAVSVTLRCEHVRPQVSEGTKQITVLPFADEVQVTNDMKTADLLYMPIPFGEEHENFARYSLSTKMVTYVGSGVPILYHGPTTSAAFELLDKNRAAFPLTTLNPAEIANVLERSTVQSRSEIVRNALALAEREFLLSDQTRKFWSPIVQCLTSG